MLRMKQYIWMNKAEFLLIALIPAGGLAVIWFFTALGNALSAQHSILIFGGLILPLMAGAIALFSSMGQILLTYDQSVKLGRTRRETVACLLGLSLLKSFSAFLISWVLCLAEESAAGSFWPLFFPDAERESLFLHIFPLWGQAVAAVVCPLAGIACGALIHRFGRKAFWVIWFIWTAGFLWIGNMDHDRFDHLLRAMGISLLPLALAVSGLLLAGLLFWGLWYLLHAAIK